MNIELLKISSCDLPHHPAYIATNLAQISCVCRLIGTTNTVWSQSEIDTLGRRAAAGEFDMHIAGPRITLSLDPDSPPVSLPVPFDGEELVTILEFAREAMADADVFANIGEKMDVADDVMARLRDKLQAVMDSDMPLCGKPTVVLELCGGKPSASLHPTEQAATDHAVACAMENLYSPDEPEDQAYRAEAEEGFRDVLSRYDRIQEGDYEVHVLVPQ